jgi:hypothetical protein
MRPTRTRVTAASVAIVAAVGLTAASCDSKFTEPFKDAPRSHHDDGSPMDVIRMSDGFSNVGFKCVGPDGIYVLYHGDEKYGSLHVVPSDPRC